VRKDAFDRGVVERQLHGHRWREDHIISWPAFGLS
jgi:hypothetical protein